MGVYFLFEAMVNLLAVVSDFGIRGGLEKRVSEGTTPSVHLGSALAMKCGILVPVLVLLVLLRDVVNGYVGEEVAFLLVVTIVLREAGHTARKVLHAELAVGKTALPQFFRHVVWFLGGVLLVEMDLGVYSLVYGLMAGYVVMFLWNAVQISTPLARPTRQSARSIMQYSKFHFFSDSIAGYVYGWMDVVIIGFFLSQSAVGVYEVAWRVTLVVMLLSDSLGTSLFPQISNWSIEGQSNEIESLLPNALTLSLVLVIPSLFGVGLLSREILTFVFGTEFAEAWLVLIVLMVEKLFRAVHVIVGHTLQAIDQPALSARAVTFSLLANFVLNVALVPTMGILGASIATSLAFSINTALHVFYTSRFLSISVPFSSLTWILASSTAMALLIRLLRPVVEVTSLVSLVLLIGLGAVFYLAVVLQYTPIWQAVFSGFSEQSA